MGSRRVREPKRAKKDKTDKKVKKKMAETIDDTRSFSINLDAKPGKGEIVNLDYPESVLYGAEFNINASTKNIGDGDGKFVMELRIDGVVESKSGEFTLAPGATSADKIPPAIAPSSGAAMSIVVNCIRIT